MFEERRRLIAGNGSEEEARLRAFEFAVNAHRAHFGADLETSKRAVTNAIGDGHEIESLKTATEGGARKRQPPVFPLTDHRRVDERCAPIPNSSRVSRRSSQH